MNGGPEGVAVGLGINQRHIVELVNSELIYVLCEHLAASL